MAEILPGFECFTFKKISNFDLDQTNTIMGLNQQ